MPSRVRLLFSVLSFTLFLTAALPLYRELTRRSDIWWTPHAMLVPLAQAADRVEIYVRGEPLATVVDPSDVGLRFNNYDRVRSERLPMLLVNAAGCGAAACMFLLILTGRLTYRRERNA